MSVRKARNALQVHEHDIKLALCDGRRVDVFQVSADTCAAAGNTRRTARGWRQLAACVDGDGAVVHERGDKAHLGQKLAHERLAQPVVFGDEHAHGRGRGIRPRVAAVGGRAGLVGRVQRRRYALRRRHNHVQRRLRVHQRRGGAAAARCTQQRDDELERRAQAKALGLHHQATAHGCRKASADGQTQARAAEPPHRGLLCLLERLEDALQLVCGCDAGRCNTVASVLVMRRVQNLQHVKPAA